MVFVKNVRGYQLRISAVSEAQAREAVRLLERQPLHVLARHEAEDRVTRDASQMSDFLAERRCA